VSELPDDWHNKDAYRAIYLAALQGILANPEFVGPAFQGEALSAAQFAREVIRASLTIIEPQEIAK
jgi:hypothetical protein